MPDTEQVSRADVGALLGWDRLGLEDGGMQRGKRPLGVDGKAFVRDRVGGRARWEEVGERVRRDGCCK